MNFIGRRWSPLIEEVTKMSNVTTILTPATASQILFDNLSALGMMEMTEEEMAEAERDWLMGKNEMAANDEGMTEVK